MEQIPIKTLCVYCGSNFGASAAYKLGAESLADAMAARGMDLVYGAGNVGLMGALADRLIERGGKATGVIPRKLADLGLSHAGLHETVIAETMRERKAIMIDRGDAFVAMPGGIGTIEELSELMTLNQLGYTAKPIGLLDTLGFWKPFISFMGHVVSEGFLKKAQLDQLVVDDDASRLLDRLSAAETRYVPKWI